MPRPAEFANPNARAAGDGYLNVAVFAAAGALLMATIGAATGVWLTSIGSSWWRTAKYLALITTLPQWLVIIAWAGVTGGLVAVGARRAGLGLRLASAALVSGALVPVGLVLLAGALNKVWPGTTGPMDKPFLTLILLVYSLVIPFGLGRAISRLQLVAVS